MEKALKDAQRRGDERLIAKARENLDKAKDVVMQDRAFVDTVHQALSQSKPAIAKIMGDKILDMKVKGPDIIQVPTGIIDPITGVEVMRNEAVEITYRQDIDSVRYDDDFVKYNKQYGMPTGTRLTPEQLQNMTPEQIAEIERQQRIQASQFGNQDGFPGQDGFYQ